MSGRLCAHGRAMPGDCVRCFRSRAAHVIAQYVAKEERLPKYISVSHDLFEEMCAAADRPIRTGDVLLCGVKTATLEGPQPTNTMRCL